MKGDQSSGLDMTVLLEACRLKAYLCATEAIDGSISTACRPR